VRAQDVQGFERAVERACNALDQAEPEITKMDTISGDGDCGLTLQTGAQGNAVSRKCYLLTSGSRGSFVFVFVFVHPAVLARLRAGSINGEDVVGALVAVSEVAAEKMGGTSGALYS
jgi:dihydroxyacetone kinase